MRGTISVAPGPAPASAAVSATEGTPNSATTRSERVCAPGRRGLQRGARQVDERQPSARGGGGDARLALLVDAGEQRRARRGPAVARQARAPAPRWPRPGSPRGSRCRWRAWAAHAAARSRLRDAPLHDRHRRPPAVERPPTGSARATCDRDELAARARACGASGRACVSSVTALTTRRPPGGSAAQAASRTAGSSPPPPTNTASGGGQAGERCGRRALDECEIRHAERQRVAGDAGGAVGARLDGDGAVGGMAQHPFDADRARARADVPQELALRAARAPTSVMARISRLVIWPSCSNSSSGRPAASGSTRAPGPATTSIATVFSGSTSVDGERSAAGVSQPLARAAHAPRRR